MLCGSSHGKELALVSWVAGQGCCMFAEVGRDGRWVLPCGQLGLDLDGQEKSSSHCGWHLDWLTGHLQGCGTGAAPVGGVACGTWELEGVGLVLVYEGWVHSVVLGLGLDYSGLLVWGEDGGVAGWDIAGMELENGESGI